MEIIGDTKYYPYTYTYPLIIVMAEKLHREDPTQTDEWNWFTAENMVEDAIRAQLHCYGEDSLKEHRQEAWVSTREEIHTLRAQVKHLSKALDEKVTDRNLALVNEELIKIKNQLGTIIKQKNSENRIKLKRKDEFSQMMDELSNINKQLMTNLTTQVN